ncbi:MAG: L-fucose/L-arabinose isomerase family protein [Lunatimonas sp.]|uniref:L-fucose/L-arabinose isomerase family protein n=1 Tax=Lunatimonas sp. TaxID=2060141 RepID=UPI00263AC52F|nr:L-fucose/L-arabinose isomerase family protein [Lunatimonas sp.]MCC5936326.1 L-fucose/L-arabinose isomerase family protein [Lunatimonas sp.]
MSITKEIYLVASGDLRLAANRTCWQAQADMESRLGKVLTSMGFSVVRGHAFDEDKGHGFIDSQRMGIEVFKKLDPTKPLIVAESVWQYSHHVLPGLTTHQGPILTLANWSGQWPGLVGMLNLNGSLTKAGVKYSTLWSKDFDDAFFMEKLSQWLETGEITHDVSHVRAFDAASISPEIAKKGAEFARRFRQNKAIMGVFDEGCMGMFNAIIPDHLLHPTGIFKERLSQSTLFAAMREVKDEEAEQVLAWLLREGMTFQWGQGDAEFTKEQTLEQCKMYIAALRLADEFGCDTIGIQYQQGLKDLVPASDLTEGLLNNTHRPPAFDPTGRELFPGKALPHFNEVDECAGLDSLITYKLWDELGMVGDNTLHDLRWGEYFSGDGVDDFIWVFLISGAAPPSHFVGGYQGASSERQPAMYFRLGGGSLKGISRPGHIVWSRVYVMDDALHADLGVGEVVALPEEETQRRWNMTTPQWPIMHGRLEGVSQNQMMAQHKANHIHVVYADTKEKALEACQVKAAALQELGIRVSLCGI